MDVLQAIAPAAQLSAVGALILVLVLLFRAVSAGDWIPRSFVDRIVANYEARIVEKEAVIAELRAGYETERTRAEVAVDHARDLASGFATVNRTLDALRARAEGTPRET